MDRERQCSGVTLGKVHFRCARAQNDWTMEMNARALNSTSWNEHFALYANSPFPVLQMFLSRICKPSSCMYNNAWDVMVFLAYISGSDRQTPFSSIHYSGP